MESGNLALRFFLLAFMGGSARISQDFASEDRGVSW